LAEQRLEREDAEDFVTRHAVERMAPRRDPGDPTEVVSDLGVVTILELTRRSWREGQ
jgi:hypothetical protein